MVGEAGMFYVLKNLFQGHLGGLVKQLTLACGSGHKLTVGGLEPSVEVCTDSLEPA